MVSDLHKTSNFLGNKTTDTDVVECFCFWQEALETKKGSANFVYFHMWASPSYRVKLTF